MRHQLVIRKNHIGVFLCDAQSCLQGQSRKPLLILARPMTFQGVDAVKHEGQSLAGQYGKRGLGGTVHGHGSLPGLPNGVI
jgi:hypothetical protein